VKCASFQSGIHACCEHNSVNDSIFKLNTTCAYEHNKTRMQHTQETSALQMQLTNMP